MKIVPAFLLIAIFPLSPLLADESKPAAPPAAQAQVVKNVTPDEAARLLQENPKIVVLDVRTPEEFARGHIPAAKNVDFLGANFAAGAKAVDAQTPVLLHCASGGRSTQALELLKDKPVIYHLKDGFKAWERAGKPVEK